MEIDSLPSILISLFQGNKIFRDILDSRRASPFERIADLLKIADALDNEKSSKITKLKEFEQLKRFLVSEVQLDYSRYGKAAIVKALLSKVLYIPACIQYTDQSSIPTAYTHDIKFYPRGEVFSAHLDSLLRTLPKFKQPPSPALIVHIDRSLYDINLMLPTPILSIHEFVEGATDKSLNYQLTAIVCLYGTEFYAFVRSSDGKSEGEGSQECEWNHYSKSGKVTTALNLENQLKFWRNMPEFSRVLSNKSTPIYRVLTAAVLAVYVPCADNGMTAATQSRARVGSASINSVPTSTNPQSRFGICKGIEGDQNSCFMDTLLMAWFSTDVILRQSLLNNIQTQSGMQNENVRQIVDSLARIVEEVNKPPFVCRKQLVWEFRNNLASFNENVLGEMMDVAEFVSTIFRKVLNSPYFIEYRVKNQISSKVVGNNLHQLITHSFVPDGNITNLQKLLVWSMEFQNLQFKSYPSPMLMIKMPRSAGVMVGHEMIFPDPVITLDDVSYKKLNTSKLQSYHLQAVICLRHMHYTAYLKYSEGLDSQWVYFNSMGSAGPEVELLDGFEAELQMLGNTTFHTRTHFSDQVKRMMQNVYLCIYTPSSSIIRTAPPSISSTRQTSLEEGSRHRQPTEIGSKRGSLVETFVITGREGAERQQPILAMNSNVGTIECQPSSFPERVEPTSVAVEARNSRRTAAVNSPPPSTTVSSMFCTSEKLHLKSVLLSLCSKYQPLQRILVKWFPPTLEASLSTEDDDAIAFVFDKMGEISKNEKPLVYSIETAWEALLGKLFKLPKTVGKNYSSSSSRNVENDSYYHKTKITYSFLKDVKGLEQLLIGDVGKPSLTVLQSDILVIVAERTSYDRKIIPPYSLQLSDYFCVVSQNPLRITGSLSAIICKDGGKYHIYCREEEPVYWTHSIVLDNGQHQGVEVPQIENFLRVREIHSGEKAIDDPAAQSAFDSCQEDLRRILQFALSYVYFLKEEKLPEAMDCGEILETSIDEEINMDVDNASSRQALPIGSACESLVEKSKISDECDLNVVGLSMPDPAYDCFAAVLYAMFRYKSYFGYLVIDPPLKRIIDQLQHGQPTDCMELVRHYGVPINDCSKFAFEKTLTFICQVVLKVKVEKQRFLTTVDSDYLFALSGISHRSSIAALIKDAEDNYRIKQMHGKLVNRCVISVERSVENVAVLPAMDLVVGTSDPIHLISIVCRDQPPELDGLCLFTTFLRIKEYSDGSLKHIWKKRNSDGTVENCPNLEARIVNAKSYFDKGSKNMPHNVNQILFSAIGLFYSSLAD